MPIFFVEKLCEAFAVQSFSHFSAKASHNFSTKNISVFDYKVIKHLTS